MATPDERDVQSTAEEAERLLAELDATMTEAQDPGPTPSETVGRISDSSHASARPAPKDERALPPPIYSPPESRAPESAPTQERLQSQQPSALLRMGVLGGIVLLAVIAISSAQKSTTMVSLLTYQSSCGSSSSSSGEWWPVLGPANDDLFQIVRSRYCGDAFINANGYLQVASFNSPSEADKFVQRLSIATRAAFRRGERYTP